MTKTMQGHDCASGGFGGKRAEHVLEDNVDMLASSMGMDATCKQTAKTKLREASASGNVSFGLFGSAGFQASAMALDDEMTKSGCSSFFLDAETVLQSMSNISCTLNNTENAAEASASAQSTVEVEVVPLQQSEIDAIDSLIAGLNAENLALIAAGQADSRAYEMNVEAKRAANAKLAQRSRIRNSRLTANSDLKMRVFSSTTSSMVESIKTDVETIARTQAEREVSKEMNGKALDSNTKAAISRKFEAEQENISNSIMNALSSSTAESNNGALVKIRVPVGLDMDGVVLTANTQSDIAAAAVGESAMDVGKSVSRKFISDLFSSNKESLKSQGVDVEGLVKAVQEGQAKKMRSANPGLLSGLFENPQALMGVAAIAAVVVVGGVAMTLVGGTSKNKRRAQYLSVNDGGPLPSAAYAPYPGGGAGAPAAPTAYDYNYYTVRG
jgi:hypothetical protein